MSNLYIVSTPIGNLQDITLRASSLLLATNILLAESTSKAGILLDFLEKQFDQKRNANLRIISLTEDEEERKIGEIVKLLESSDAALISEAGTPLISDPGFKLVREAIKRNINIIPIPGATAAMAALASSGLPSDKFIFIGFLPKSELKKQRILKDAFDNPIKATKIVYESPQRLIETLSILLEVTGDTDIVIARELTKIHEEIIRSKVSNAIEHFRKKQPRGEFVVLF